jgi:hypothetical protein
LPWGGKAAIPTKQQSKSGMDISFEDYLRYSLKQFITIGFGLLEAVSPQ